MYLLVPKQWLLPGLFIWPQVSKLLSSFIQVQLYWTREKYINRNTCHRVFFHPFLLSHHLSSAFFHLVFSHFNLIKVLVPGFFDVQLGKNRSTETKIIGVSPVLQEFYLGAHFSTSTKTGTLHKRLAWPLCMDNTQIWEVLPIKKEKKHFIWEIS